MSDPIVTTGIPVSPPAPGGAVPLRREIRSLEKDFPDLWNLYLLGLKDFQEVDENEDLSYYQIAGIHGLPFKAWNGVEGDDTTGYCTHSSILFPTWHRPYLALFEETLYAHVLKKAGEFSESEGRARYVAAAQNFRMPYWDWAIVVPAGESVVPTSLSSETIQVTQPGSGGRKSTIDNPLYGFRFHPINPSQGDFPDNQVSTWDTTVRWPKDGTSVSQNDLIASDIELNNSSRSSNLRERLTLLVTSYKQYGPFSNQAWDRGQPGRYGSIEGVHDTIHTSIGGQGSTNDDFPGHMSMIPYAAFDPAFWLHHTNIDRLTAMWQVINPKTFVTPQPATQGTVTTQAGETESINTSLTPFWKNQNDFYTSADVVSTEPFGFAYPETQRWTFNTEENYEASVKSAFANLYGGSNLGFILRNSQRGRISTGAQINVPARATAATSRGPSAKISSIAASVVSAVKHVGGGDQKPLQENTPQHDGKSDAKPSQEHTPQHSGTSDAKPGKENAGHGHHNTDRDIHDLVVNGKYLEWITNLKAQKHGLGGVFFVHIFLGEFERDNPSSWRSAPNAVGKFTVLGDTPDTVCKKCKTDQDSQLQITGQVPLTLALVERYLSHDLENLTPEKVVPYLQKNLHWRVTLANGIEKPRSEVPDLVVSVISNEVTVPTHHDQFPVYSDDYQVHPEITTALNGDGRGENTGLTDVGQT